VRTIEGYLGIDVNHLVEVNFENFPAFIDALGGVNVRTGCVVSRINGGYKNGGYTLRLRPARTTSTARRRSRSRAPARTSAGRRRTTSPAPAASRRSSPPSRAGLLSPTTFVRLPWVSWAAPKAVRSDMAGPSLLGLFGAVATGGTPETEVLGRVGPDGNPSVTDAVKQREVARFLKG
jgi:hypothetical protein